MFLRIFAVMLTGFVCFGAASASADTSYVAHHDHCYVDGASVARSAQRVANNDTAAPMYVRCGFGRLTTSSPSILFVDFDNNSNPAGLVCSALIYSWTGGLLWSSAQSDSFEGPWAFRFDLPTNLLGYVVANCSVPTKNGRSAGIIGANLQ